MSSEAGRRTIEDFGSQWTRYPDSTGFYGSLALLRDICEPLLGIDELRDKVVLEIGSGAGRIVSMLLDAGVAKVIAVEPSDAMNVLRTNTAHQSDRIEYVRAAGHEIPDRKVDFVLSIGVLHHIPDPAPVVRRAHDLLKPGGRMLFWVYGREGNEAYLRLVLPLRRITQRLPDGALGAFSHALNAVLTPYIWLCRWIRLPLSRYLTQVLGRFDWRRRSLVIFDQLNPQYARYYEAAEARELIESAGFVDVRLHHRHGYSWTLVGTRR